MVKEFLNNKMWKSFRSLLWTSDIADTLKLNTLVVIVFESSSRPHIYYIVENDYEFGHLILLLLSHNLGL